MIEPGHQTTYRRAAGRAREALLHHTPQITDHDQQWINTAIAQQRQIARPQTSGHSLAWLAWLTGGLWMVAQTTHPLYLLIIWGCALLVATACASEGPLAGAGWLLLRLGAVIFGLHLFFSVFSAGFLRGQTVLVELPTWTLPRLMGGVQLGGAVTLEQLVSGAARGLRLWTVLMIVGAFNASVNHYRLIRRTPRLLLHAGVVVTIALAFVPQTVLRLRAIRAAQRLRGHRFRSWRDALPLMIPLLSGGLERALALAEAMEARGYGRADHQPMAQTTPKVASLASLGLLMMGCFLYIINPAASSGAWLGLGCLLAGSTTLGLSWWRASQRINQSRYLRERWSRATAWMGLLSLVAPVGLALLTRDTSALSYRIFPRVSLPGFDPGLAIPLLLLAAPAWLLARPARPPHT